MKHALLLALLERLPRGGRVVLETHAGAGLYDLSGEAARRSGEAEGGVGRLIAAEAPPAALARLRARVLREDGSGRIYPGSPVLTLESLGPGERYIGCELRAEEAARLEEVLGARARPGGAGAEARTGDGWSAAFPARPEGPRLLVIDPPYEAGDDARRVASRVARARSEGAAVLVWAPVKDLESLDRLLRDLEAVGPRRLDCFEARTRPLDNPMRLNGSAVILVDAPELGDEALEVCAFVAGEGAGAASRARRLV